MTITYQQKAEDNEALRGGVVNQAAGSLPMRPYNLSHGFAVLFAAIIALLSNLLIPVISSFILFLAIVSIILVWGGKDFNLEKEKFMKTRSFYSELPLKDSRADGLPYAVLSDEPVIVRNEKKYHSMDQEFKHLRFLGSYEKNRSNAGFFYLNQGTSPNTYLVFGFKVAGFSPCMDHVDCMQAVKEISRAVRNYPDIKLRFVCSIPSDGSAQILQQKAFLEQEGIDPVSVEIVKDRGRWAVNKENEGAIVAPELYVYARVKSSLGQEKFVPQDWKDKWAAQLTPTIEKLFGSAPKQALAMQAIDFAFDTCCTPVMRMFNSEISVKARPLTVHELYVAEYKKLHSEPVEACPQYIRVTDQGLFEHEENPGTQHHILADLFQEETRAVLPVFYRNRLWLPLKGGKDENGKPKGRFAACVRLDQLEAFPDIGGSHAVGHLQNTVRWLHGLSDVELITEIEAIDDLQKKKQIQRGITNRTKRFNVSTSKGLPDADSMDDMDDLHDARNMLRAGGRVLSTCCLIWAYADTVDLLNQKTSQIVNRIGADQCTLVQNSIENYWIDSQPYCWDAMGTEPAWRRSEYMISQTIPLLPLTQPQPLDNAGIGFVGKHITAQYFIDFCKKKNHTFISAKSGGGKSMTALDVMAQCILTETPFMFLDSPPIADSSKQGEVAASTYTPAIELWQQAGIDCAYQDIKKQNFNAIGRYGLGRNSWEIDVLVEANVDTLEALVLGDAPKHPRKETVRNILSLSYKAFAISTMDAEVDPIVSEYLTFYMDWSRQYLSGDIDMEEITGVANLGKFEPTDLEREAVGLIRSQLVGVLGQPWGQRINAQTAFSQDTKYLVLGLTDVKEGSKEGLVYALAALAFMNRMTSTHAHSVFGMDEGSTLLPMEAFASKFSRIFPEGRKKGGNGILITTEPESLFNSRYCSAILNNFDNALVGLSENEAVTEFVKRMGFKEEILRHYTEAPKTADMSSSWYLKRGNTHLELKYYTTRFLLALGATHPYELKAKRAYVTADSLEEKIQQYKDFGKDLYSAYKQGRGPLSLIR